MPRATQPTVDCLYTHFQNIAPVSRFYGFLGEHGRTLAANEVVTEPGDVATKLATKSRRDFQSLERCLKGFTDAAGAAVAPCLLLVKTPAPFLIDETTDDIKTLRLNNGSLAVADTCLGAYSSE